MGIIAEDVAAHEVVAPEVAEWEHMSEYERKCSSRSMAAYAAMVEQMDHNIGRVIDYLQETGAYDNTVILFMSDNGRSIPAFRDGVSCPLTVDSLLQVPRALRELLAVHVGEDHRGLF